MFSPDDALVLTGESVMRGQSSGRLLFFDSKTFEKSHEIEVSESVCNNSEPSCSFFVNLSLEVFM